MHNRDETFIIITLWFDNQASVLNVFFFLLTAQQKVIL